MKRQKNKIQQTDFTDKTKSFHAFPPHFQRRSHGKHKKTDFSLYQIQVARIYDYICKNLNTFL